MHYIAKKTVKLIIDGENDYIITIKGNQPNLLKTVTELAESSIAIGANVHYERLHGRSTTREVKVYLILPDLLSDWVGARSLIEVNRSGTRPQGKKGRRQIVNYHKRHFYLSSLTYCAAEFAAAIAILFDLQQNIRIKKSS